MASELEERAYRLLVGERIRLLRAQRGLSQEGLGLAADRDRSYVGEIERGDKSPTIDTLFSLAAALSVEPRDLLPKR